MSRNFNDANSGGNKFNAPELEPGGYPGRLVGICFLGVQKQKAFQGQAKKPVDEVRYTYELSDEFMKDENGEDLTDRPRWFSERLAVYGPDADKAKLTKRNKALDPNNESGGDARKMLSRAGNIMLVHNPGKGANQGKVFTNVGDVGAAIKLKNYTQPDLVNPTFYYDPMDENCTLEEFRAQPEFVQKLILEADDHAISVLARQLQEARENGEDVPEGGQAAGHDNEADPEAQPDAPDDDKNSLY